MRINSERDDSQADSTHPFGPGPVKASRDMATAERDGYKARNIDNYAGDFEFGVGDEVLGIFAIWMSYQQAVAGTPTLTSQSSKMANSMRVGHQMTKVQQWLAIMLLKSSKNLAYQCLKSPFHRWYRRRIGLE